MEKDIEREEIQEEVVDYPEVPTILAEITMEEMAVDGICGIY